MKLLPFLAAFLVLTVAAPSPAFADAELSSFTSDGCSLFPDGKMQDPELWCECCFIHDIAYWRGGSSEDRKTADLELQDCVLKRTGDKTLATIMFEGVRAGGHPVFPTGYRWGYGWRYGRGYVSLSDDEWKQVAARLTEYYASNPGGYCRKSGK